MSALTLWMSINIHLFLKCLGFYFSTVPLTKGIQNGCFNVSLVKDCANVTVSGFENLKFKSVSTCIKLTSFKIQSPCKISGSICGEKGICVPNYQDGSLRCKCTDGFRGPTCG